MTIVVPKQYHARPALEESRVLCMDQDQAQREDIRALQIGILNIMPQAETYEFSLLHPLGRSVLQIEPIWIRLKTHVYTSTSRTHLENLYVHFEEYVKHNRLDGLLLTGAPVEDIPFEDVSYWDEVKRILKYAHNNIPSTLGICWGGLALAKFIGIDKVMLPKKVFGVFETTNLDRNHRITGDMDDVFWCPQSRHSGIPDAVLEEEQKKGNVRLLAHCKEGGYTIFESADQRFLMHLGHPEYEPERLVFEYNRDMQKGCNNVDPPANLDVSRPANRWRTHRAEFFSQWIKYVHEVVSF